MNSGAELRTYVSVMTKHRNWSYFFLLCILVLWYLFNFHAPKYYEANTLIYVPKKDTSFSLQDSRGVLKKAPLPLTEKNLMASYLGFLENAVLLNRLSRRIPERSAREIKKNTRINVYVRRCNYRIYVKDRVPAIAAKIANAYGDEANKLLQERSLGPLKATRMSLEKRMRETESDLNEAERHLEEFKDKTRTVSPAQEKSQFIQQRTAFESQLKESRIRLEEVASNIEITRKSMDKEGKMQLSSESVTTNPVINHLRTALSSLEISLAGARSKYSGEHPEVIRLEREFAQTKRNLKKEVEKVLGSQTKSINPVYERLRQMLVTDLVAQKSLQARIEGLERVIRELDLKIEKFPELDKKLADLARRVQNYEKALQMLKMKIEEAKLQEIREIQTFMVLDRAKVPEDPVSPHLLKSTILLIILSIHGLIFVPYLVEYLSGSLNLTGGGHPGSANAGKRFRPNNI
jgi:uncharacterized protein involved in exopolysaccharide biosynthesis